ncbi:hypothetical protein MYAM1_000020 [Malassezia yamatoensis]|uniref:Nitroreductase domain-containing protein n=1 Tax=Malassezia yamatoensis TaxID=253288 RepID=A0AAJ5YQH1_9BASI|nr:hypothetical protein MYAM1_000020 [Malassezia yamatoensis]
MASQQLARQFLSAVTNRRTIYHLSKKQILPDSELVQLVQQAVREAPSAFNVQSSRVVLLLGKEHDRYWKQTVVDALRSAKGEKAVTASEPKLQGFAAGAGTILFFEDENLIKQQQETYPSYAVNFPVWSLHSSGMAQVYTWSLLEAEGYGANLQHYGNLTAEMLKQQYNVPESWRLQSEMVFGYPESPAGEKEYMPDHERVIAYGHSDETNA